MQPLALRFVVYHCTSALFILCETYVHEHSRVYCVLHQRVIAAMHVCLCSCTAAHEQGIHTRIEADAPTTKVWADVRAVFAACLAKKH